MKKTFLAILAVIVFLGVGAALLPGHTFAGAASDPKLYQIEVTSLPHATADNSKIQTIMGIVFGIIGALSVMMLTIGGFRYITSQGDPQDIAKAKSTIIYALVGVLVSILAVVIVTFIVGKV